MCASRALEALRVCDLGAMSVFVSEEGALERGETDLCGINWRQSIVADGG